MMENSELIFAILFQFTQLLLVVLAAPLLTGWVNQCQAWLQNRSGAGVLQPYRVLHKLFNKDAVIAYNASPLFRATPYIVFGCMWLAAAIIPILAVDLPFSRAADVIALVGVFAVARVFIALAAMDIGTAFGTLGARREMLVSFLAEPALLMVLFTASMISHSTQLPNIVDTLAHHQFVIYPSLAFAALAFVIVLLAENARIPVDNPNTHLELTMIHEVMVLDHSGPDLALIFYGAAMKLLVLGAVVVRVAIPVNLGNQALDLGVFILGMIGLAVLIGVIESIMARLQLLRIPQFLIGTILLSFFSLIMLLR